MQSGAGGCTSKSDNHNSKRLTSSSRRGRPWGAAAIATTDDQPPPPYRHRRRWPTIAARAVAGLVELPWLAMAANVLAQAHGILPARLR